MADSVISCSGLTKHYGGWLSSGERAVVDLDLEVQRGQIYGLLGPNGAGKTTFVKAMLGLVRITRGEASLLGTAVPNVNVRQRVGYLPEDHRLPPHLTGLQAVNYYGKLNGIPLHDRDQRSERLLNKVEMWDARHTKIKTYSKGMKQRLGIVQALINDPEVVFLDEPTDGIDPVGRKTIRSLLEELVEKDQKTIFINSHILTELELICDSVAIMKDGRMIREGTLEELRGTEITYDVHYQEHPDGAFLSDVQERWTVTEQEQGCSVQLDSSKQIDDLVQLIYRHELSLREFSGTRQSLEDFFIDVVTEEK